MSKPGGGGGIRTAVAATSAVRRAGLESIIRSHADFHLAGSFGAVASLVSFARSAELDVMVIDSDSILDSLPELTPGAAIVLLTEVSDPRSISRLLRSGVRAILTRESDPDDVLSAIDNEASAERLGISCHPPRLREYTGLTVTKKREAPLRLSYGRRHVFLLVGVLVCGAATSRAQTGTTAGASTPGQSIPGTGGVSPFAGSVPAKMVAGVLPLSLQDAIDRGLKQNLGLLLSSADIRSARGQRWEQLSALLPHVTAAPYVAESKLNVDEIGFAGLASVLHTPSSVGPFSYFDARASVTQTLFDWKSISATRAAGQSLKSAEYSFKDARDLVVLAVGYTYLQAIADEARIETSEAQVKTAQAVYDQATDQVNAGTSPDIDALRAKVELQTRQQQLIQARNNFAIQKLTVARVIGLAPGQEFEFTDKSPYQPFESITIEEALKRAYASRSDYQAAMNEVRAAELSRKAAMGGYFPSLSFNADYGLASSHPSTATPVADVRGTLSIPIFQGGSRSRRRFAGRCETRAESRAPGKSAGADRLRRAHGAAQPAVVGGSGNRGEQQHRFGGTDAGPVARSFQRGCDRHGRSGAIARSSRQRARAVHLESLQL